MTILAGDLGGTKTLLGLYDEGGAQLLSRRYEAADWDSLDAMVVAFLAEAEVRGAAERCGAPRRAVLGVAGPVEELSAERQRARITNLTWDLDSRRLEEVAGLERVRLVNDFYAVAAATAAWAQAAETGIAPDSLVALTSGLRPRPRGAVAILGAGTGLGEAMVARATHAPLILPSEGGHGDFAARDEVEIALFRFLQRRHGPHVSYERVLCGAGLLALYEFYREAGEAPESPALREAIEQDRSRAPALVSREALAGTDRLCVAALDRFARIYGAEAGNHALRCLATGGVFLAGGIAPKILPKLQDGAFLEGFLQKGRFEGLLKGVPVYVIVHGEAGLYGAAVLARGL